MGLNEVSVYLFRGADDVWEQRKNVSLEKVFQELSQSDYFTGQLTE